MAKSKKLDVETVRQAAGGRWVDILHAVGGIPMELLDASCEHPCPACGGETRFRLIDEAAGAVRCSHCFAEKCGDGFAAIAWVQGVSFPDAVKLIAKYCGVAASKDDADPAKDLEWQPWSSAQVPWLQMNKPGITEAALLANGCRQAMYKKNYRVFALPVMGSDLDVNKPCGWVIFNFDGSPLPVWNKSGEVVRVEKVKLTYGSKPGIVGTHAVDRLRTKDLVELCWKVEGVSDMLALFDKIPEHLRDRHVVLTNGNGAREKPRWMATLLANYNTNVVHDADQPGQIGADDWTRQIASQAAESIQIRNVPLPFEIEETKGKDLRDFFNEGHDYAELLSLAEQELPASVPRTESGDVDLASAAYPDQDRMLKKLQVEVLYEEESSAIRVFSTCLRKSSTIRKISQLKLDDIYQICGPPAIEHIVTSAADAGDDLWTMADVRKGFAIAASKRRGDHDERGIGIWQGLDPDGNEVDSLILVNKGDGARWNGDGILQRILAPRSDGLVLDFGTASKDWYEFDALTRNLEAAADVDWRENVIEEATQLFARWRWRNPETDPTLMTGLTLASFVQTIFAWRPLVAISGESNGGKSLLFDLLGGQLGCKGLFGNLAFKQSKSTAAGVMQGIGKSARVPLCDEFEASKERDKILEAFRQSTRGDSKAMGSSHQKVIETVLRHIGWIAAVETGLQRQPDSNRFVQLEVKTAEKGKHGQLRIPDGRELMDLGQKMLAIAVRCGIKAKRMAVAMKDSDIPGIDPRTVETYGVPAAMLAVAGDLDEAMGRAILQRLLASVDRGDQGRVDQEELLGDILTASVFLNSKDGTKTVAQVLESPGLRSDASITQRVEACGVRLLVDANLKGVEDYSLFIAPRLVSQHLLRGGPWERQKIDQILLRLPGAARHILRIGGRVTRGLIVPAGVVKITDEPGTQKEAF